MLNKQTIQNLKNLKDSPRVLMTIVVLSVIALSVILISYQNSRETNQVQKSQEKTQANKTQQEEAKKEERAKTNYSGFTSLFGVDMKLNTSSAFEMQRLQYGGYSFFNPDYEIITEPFTHMTDSTIAPTSTASETKIEEKFKIMGISYGLLEQYVNGSYITRVIQLSGPNTDPKTEVMPEGMLRVNRKTDTIKQVNLYPYEYKIIFGPRVRMVINFKKELSKITPEDIKTLEKVTLSPDVYKQAADKELDSDNTGRLFGSPLGSKNVDLVDFEFDKLAVEDAPIGYDQYDHGRAFIKSIYYTNSLEFQKYGVVPIFATCTGNLDLKHSGTTPSTRATLNCKESIGTVPNNTSSYLLYYNLEVLLACVQDKPNHNTVEVKKGDIIGFQTQAKSEQDSVQIKTRKAGQKKDYTKYEQFMIKDATN
jgi:hypothetical protein